MILESSRSRSNNSRKRRLNNKRVNRNRSISLMKVDLSNPSKQYDVNNEDAISEHKSEYISFSQSQKYRKLKSEDI